MDREKIEKAATLGTLLATGLVAGYFWYYNSKPQQKQTKEDERVGDLKKLGDGTELQPDYGQALKIFGDRCEKFGEGVGFVDVFGTKTLFVTDPEMARKMLGHSVQHALWGGLTAASEAFFGKNVLFVLEGEKWRFLRNTMKHSLVLQNVKLMTKDVASIAQTFADNIKVNEAIDFNELIGIYHLSAIGKSAFDFDLNHLAQKGLGPTAISQAFDFFIDELPRRSLNPDQSVDGDYEADNEQNRKWQEASKLLRTTIEEVVKKRLVEMRLTFTDDSNFLSFSLKKKLKKCRPDLLSGMIIAHLEQDAIDGESKRNENSGWIQITKARLNDLISNMTDNLVEILFAGYNTNVGTIANALHFLAMHPDVQQKCFNEITNFMKESGKEFDAKSFAANFTFSQFPTIENVFLETLRMRPPAPMLARFLTKEFEFVINGKLKTLPKDVPLWIPVEYLHMNQKHWNGFKTKEFKPERFQLKNPCKTGSFLPFSGGPRDCIGKNFAKLEAMLALIFLLRKYQFRTTSDYEYKSMFNGFGYRPFDALSKTVCMKLVAIKRLSLNFGKEHIRTVEAKMIEIDEKDISSNTDPSAAFNVVDSHGSNYINMNLMLDSNNAKIMFQNGSKREVLCDLSNCAAVTLDTSDVAINLTLLEIKKTSVKFLNCIPLSSDTRFIKRSLKLQFTSRPIFSTPHEWLDTIHTLSRTKPTGKNEYKFLIYFNPLSGTGKASSILEEVVKPLYDSLGFKLTTIETTSPGFAETHVNELEKLSEFDSIIIISGDGLFHEVLQGVMQRNDWAEVVKKVSFGIIPAGTGNGLATTVLKEANENLKLGNGWNNACLIALNQIKLMDIGVVDIKSDVKGSEEKFDLENQLISSTTRKYSFLSVEWGASSFLDIDSERARWLGSLRFTLWAVLAVIKGTKYKGRVSYLPYDSSEALSSYWSSSQASLDQPLKPSLDEPIPDSWTTVESTKFLDFWSTNVAWISSDASVSRAAKVDDGLIHATFITSGRKALLDFLLSMSDEEGGIAAPSVNSFKTQNFRLEPLDRDEDLIRNGKFKKWICLDGEEVEYSAVQIQNLCKFLRLHAINANSIKTA